MSSAYYCLGTFQQAFILPQNIIKKVSGQKFVYKFVTFPDPNSADGLKGPEDSQRANMGEKLELSVQSKSNTGANTTNPCLSKSLQVQRFSTSTLQRSSRNDYMKSGLYSTFTIQSLQTASKFIKTEYVLSDNSPHTMHEVSFFLDFMFLF